MNLAVFPKCFMDVLCVHRTMTLFEWIEIAKELQPLGVTGLEFYPDFLAETGVTYLEDVKAALCAAGFEMPMFCASPDFTFPDADARAREIERQRRMIDLTAYFGGKTCRVLSGQRRPEVQRAQGIAWVVDALRELVPYAESRGVILAMENHFKDNYWIYPEFAQKMEIFCEIAGQIDSPSFGVNFDPSNTLLAGEDPLEFLDRVKERVVSMHASDRRPRSGVPPAAEITDYSQLVHGEIGTGLIDFDSIFRILSESGFDGWVSIEDGINGMEELKRSATYLHRYIYPSVSPAG